MDPVVKANFMLLFSVEVMAKARAEGDLHYQKLLVDEAETKVRDDLEGKLEDDERSDDSQRTIPYIKPADDEHSDDSQRTIPYKPEDDKHPAAEQPAYIPVPIPDKRSFKRSRPPLLADQAMRPPLLADQAMKDSCSRFNKEIRAKRKPYIGK
jgi:hypothetical protein